MEQAHISRRAAKGSLCCSNRIVDAAEDDPLLFAVDDCKGAAGPKSLGAGCAERFGLAAGDGPLERDFYGWREVPLRFSFVCSKIEGFVESQFSTPIV